MKFNDPKQNEKGQKEEEQQQKDTKDDLQRFGPDTGDLPLNNPHEDPLDQAREAD